MRRFIIAMLWTLSSIPAIAAAQPAGQITCRVSENGKAAAGTLRLEQQEKTLASGACDGRPLSVPPGTYTAILSLDGALDSPEQRRSVTIASGKNPAMSGEFRTGTLRIDVVRDGRRAAAKATLEKDGKRVGTLGGGVTAHLSAGSYTVIVRCHDEEKRYERVVISADAHRDLSATF